jgi:hypothetical protein
MSSKKPKAKNQKQKPEDMIENDIPHPHKQGGPLVSL